MKTVSDYSVREHGIMLPDYFQGQGTSYTGFDDVATGIGETAEEAFEDALDQLAQNDWETSTIPCPDYSKSPSVTDYLEKIGVEQDAESADSSYWYVSVLVK